MLAKRIVEYFSFDKWYTETIIISMYQTFQLCCVFAFNLNNVWTFSSNITADKMNPHYEDQQVDAVYGELCEIYKHNVREDYSSPVLETGGTYSNQRALHR